MFMSSRRILASENQHQQNSYGKKKANNQKSCIKIKKCFCCHFLLLSSNLIASTRNTIARHISYVNVVIPKIVLSGIKLGVNTIMPIAPAERFVSNPEEMLSKDLLVKNLVKEELIIL